MKKSGFYLKSTQMETNGKGSLMLPYYYCIWLIISAKCFLFFTGLPELRRQNVLICNIIDIIGFRLIIETIFLLLINWLL
jgi:hypothetical protein